VQTSSPDKIAAFAAKGWWTERTLTHVFDEAVAAAPDRPALADPPNRPDIAFGAPRRLTYAEAALEVERMAAALAHLGVKLGDRVLVQLPNIIEFVLLYLAIARVGAIISPAPMQYRRHELTHILGVLKPDLLISITRFKGEDISAQHHAAFPDLPIAALGPSTAGGVTSFEAVMTAAARPAPKPNLSGNDIFTICWTSGTTGRPKGVPRSYNHWFNQCVGMEDGVNLKPYDVLLNPFPFVNMAAISGFLFVWLYARGLLVMHHPFELPVMLKQLHDEKVAYTVVPPAVLNMLLQKKEMLGAYDISALHTICSGSAPLSPWMVKGYKDLLNIDVVNTFGSNEGVALITSGREVPDAEHRARYFPRFGVDGIAWSNRISERIQTKLVDPQTGELITEPGRPGEFLIRGPNVFDGYLDSPEDNAQVFDADGYFRSGDLLEIVGDETPPRFYRFVGRCKDIIIRGGMNISPEEVDTLLVTQPKIAEAAVFGIPDPILGERVCVAAVAKPGQELTLDDIKEHLSGLGVAIFKWPERLISIPALPRNALGKVVRGELKKLL
jgi:acyl-CoA synthetase (AMP-forming)/AMP-acid ligase II